jgi:hypothetical protein
MSTPDETGKSTADDVSAGPIVVIGIVGAILVFALIVAMQAVFLREEEKQRQEKVVGVPEEGIRALRADQLGALNGYRWIDEKKGVVGIPIDRAMELLVEESKR